MSKWLSTKPILTTWDDLQDAEGNKLHIGHLKNVTKHGKGALSFVNHVPLRDVKFTLFLVVCLFEEHSRVTEDDSFVEDSLMKLIKKSSQDETIHSIQLERSNLPSLALLLISYVCC
jgi:hypothetical protein